MTFINKLREMIREYESYIKYFPENRMLFRMITAELKVLEKEYFSEKEVDTIEKDI